MTCVLALGASKSVLFNNVLNTVNLASWVFIVTAGLFYVDTNSWVEHEGFLPFGWSGVSTSLVRHVTVCSNYGPVGRFAVKGHPLGAHWKPGQAAQINHIY